MIDGPEGRKEYQVLEIFPFSSESKCMGIIVQYKESIIYYLKGADAVM